MPNAGGTEASVEWFCIQYLCTAHSCYTISYVTVLFVPGLFGAVHSIYTPLCYIANMHWFIIVHVGVDVQWPALTDPIQRLLMADPFSLKKWTWDIIAEPEDLAV